MKNAMNPKFWKWVNKAVVNEEDEPVMERTLFLYGTIAEESWFDDDITPAMFKDELFAGDGPITIWINSPGGDCIAASQIYSAIEMLSEVKESIINAYEIKTSLSRTKLSHLMDEETWMNAMKAIELGFADGMLEDEKRAPANGEAYAFSGKAAATNLINKLSVHVEHYEAGRLFTWLA